jgi:hypothetical protein
LANLHHGLPPGKLAVLKAWIANELAKEAQGIEARSDETPQAAQPEGREPGGEAMRPKAVSTTQKRGVK